MKIGSFAPKRRDVVQIKGGVLQIQGDLLQIKGGVLLAPSLRLLRAAQVAESRVEGMGAK